MMVKSQMNLSNVHDFPQVRLMKPERGTFSRRVNGWHEFYGCKERDENQGEAQKLRAIFQSSSRSLDLWRHGVYSHVANRKSRDRFDGAKHTNLNELPVSCR